MATRKKTAAAPAATPKLTSFFSVAAAMEQVLGPASVNNLKHGGSNSTKGSKFDQTISLSLEDFQKIAEMLDNTSFDIQVVIRGKLHKEWQPANKGAISAEMLAQLGLPNQ